MYFKEFYSKYQLDDTVARQAGFNPYFPEIQSGLEDPIVIGNRQFVNLASNNYLGLAGDTRLKEAAIEGIRKYGVSMCATPIASGYSDLFREAEEAISAFCGLQESLIFPSCYQANNGLFKCIAGQGDMIVYDRYCHSSLIEGIRSSGSNSRPFRHNDPNHLENILKHCKGYEQVIVVTESVFSTEGAIAPFSGIYELCLRYGAIPVVDDSHGIGVLGERGTGILEYAGISGYQGIYTASLGKALAVNGGIVSGKASLIRFIRYSSSHLIYSTALSPASLKALLCVIGIVKDEFPERSKKMWGYSAKLGAALRNSGYPLTDSSAPIVSVCPGNSVDTLVLTKKLFRKYILVTPFIYPSVPENQGRIRLIAGANLCEESIEKACLIFEKLKPTSYEMLPDHQSPIKRRKVQPAG